jgi:hypothetical protein
MQRKNNKEKESSRRARLEVVERERCCASWPGLNITALHISLE